MNSFKQDYKFALTKVINFQYATVELLQKECLFFPDRAKAIFSELLKNGDIKPPSTKGFSFIATQPQLIS